MPISRVVGVIWLVAVRFYFVTFSFCVYVCSCTKAQLLAYIFKNKSTYKIISSAILLPLSAQGMK
jgi:hypothetical protein